MFDNFDGFIWDKGNTEKNLIKHNISCEESEEIFLDENQIIVDDEKHSGFEKRWLIIGETHSGTLLAVVFTVRNTRVRIISARRASKKEKNLYEK